MQQLAEAQSSYTDTLAAIQQQLLQLSTPKLPPQKSSALLQRILANAYSEDFEKYLHTLSLSDGGFDRVAEAVEINFQQIKRLTEDVADMRDKLATSFAVIKSAKSSKGLIVSTRSPEDTILVSTLNHCLQMEQTKLVTAFNHSSNLMERLTSVISLTTSPDQLESYMMLATVLFFLNPY